MLTYTYTARDPKTGQQVKANVQADNEQAAAKLVHQEGLVPLSIKLEEGMGGGPLKFLHRVPIKDKVLFSRQLATLINAGLPLVQSLHSVANQTTNKVLKLAINQIIADVEGGSTLAKAMAKFPSLFNQIYISLIAAGEASGTLDAALERLALQQEKDADLSSKLRNAMIYPIIVLLVMGGVVGFMIVKVLPQVQTLYDGMPGAKLPLITTILLAISNFVIHKWWIVAIILVILVFFGTRYARSAGGKRIVDKVKLKAWPISGLMSKMYMARFCRTGCTLVASGVPLVRVLEITSNAINNFYLEQAVKRATEKVKGGKALSDSLEVEPTFLPLVPSMIHIGEQSGSMEDMMKKAAEYYEKEVDDQVKAISTIIEPVLMVILGVVAFIIVAAVLLPIYGLASQSGLQVH